MGGAVRARAPNPKTMKKSPYPKSSFWAPATGKRAVDMTVGARKGYVRNTGRNDLMNITGTGAWSGWNDDQKDYYNKTYGVGSRVKKKTLFV